MIIHAMPVGLVGTNCYVIADELTREGAVIDPGGDPEHILSVVEGDGLTVRYVLNTHAHIDHTAANRELCSATGAPLGLHPADRDLLMEGGGSRWFGFPSVAGPEPSLALADGQVLRLGNLEMVVLHTPGHSPGHVAFHLREEAVLFSGDALFQRSVGRTDLPGGDWATLLRSIRDKLMALPDETVVYPGHGPATTIAAERRGNPFLLAR